MFVVGCCGMRVVEWCVFFFKQKTAYEMRISDWSSDVCSSDLATGVGAWSGLRPRAPPPRSRTQRATVRTSARSPMPQLSEDRVVGTCIVTPQIGRASCRERVCQYV